MTRMSKICLLFLLSSSCAPNIQGKGAFKHGAAPGDGLDLDNYEWWQSGKIPPYVWVLACLFTGVSVLALIISECCPGCSWLASLKARLVQVQGGRRGQPPNSPFPACKSKVISISSDEFVLPCSMISPHQEEKEGGERQY